jgi:hypothetical protein
LPSISKRKQSKTEIKTKQDNSRSSKKDVGFVVHFEPNVWQYFFARVTKCSGKRGADITGT